MSKRKIDFNIEDEKISEKRKRTNKKTKNVPKRDFKTRCLVILTKQISKQVVIEKLNKLKMSIYDGPEICRVGSEKWKYYHVNSGAYEDFVDKYKYILENCNVDDWLEDMIEEHGGFDEFENLWLDYKGQDVVLLDFNNQEKFPCNELSSMAGWIQHLVYNARTFVNFSSKMLIIFSDKPMSEWDVNNFFITRDDCILDDNYSCDENVDKLNHFLSTDVIKSVDFLSRKKRYCINQRKYKKIKD